MGGIRSESRAGIPRNRWAGSSESAGWILPIFYYLHLAGQSRNGAINSLKSNKHAKPKTRTEFNKLLQGKRSIFEKSGGKRLTTLHEIRAGGVAAISELDRANEIAHALSGITAEDETRFGEIHELLNQCRAVWETRDGDATLLARIRRAAARLDELEYGPLVPEE
jgi:hypothetical protein